MNVNVDVQERVGVKYINSVSAKLFLKVWFL